VLAGEGADLRAQLTARIETAWNLQTNLYATREQREELQRQLDAAHAEGERATEVSRQLGEELRTTAAQLQQLQNDPTLALPQEFRNNWDDPTGPMNDECQHRLDRAWEILGRAWSSGGDEVGDIDDFIDRTTGECYNNKVGGQIATVGTYEYVTPSQGVGFRLKLNDTVKDMMRLRKYVPAYHATTKDAVKPIVNEGQLKYRGRVAAGNANSQWECRRNPNYRQTKARPCPIDARCDPATMGRPGAECWNNTMIFSSKSQRYAWGHAAMWETEYRGPGFSFGFQVAMQEGSFQTGPQTFVEDSQYLRRVDPKIRNDDTENYITATAPRMYPLKVIVVDHFYTPESWEARNSALLRGQVASVL